MTAIEILESSRIREDLPHLFPDVLTRDSVATDKRGNIVLPPAALAAVMRWVIVNPCTASDIATVLDAI